MNPIAGAGPEIALRIDAEAVEQIYGAFGKHVATASTLIVDVEAADMAPAVERVRRSCIGDAGRLIG